MRFGWAGKVAIGAAVPVVVGLGAFLLIALNHAREVTRETIEEDLLNTVSVLAHALTSPEIEAPRLQERVIRLGREIGERVTVIDGTGVVLADSEAHPPGMENHGRRPEVVKAKEVGRAVVARFSSTVKRPLVYAAARVPGSDVVVRVARDVSDVEASLRRTTDIFWPVAVVVAALGALGAILFARGMTRPLRDLTDAARKVQAGDLDAKVLPSREDEVGVLGRAFNRMTEQLRETLGRAEAETARLSTILEGMTEGVIAIDAEERISFLNRRARRILGLDAEQPVAGVRLYELVRDPRILGLVQMAASRKETAEAEIRHDGPPRRMVQVFAAPVGGESPGVIVVLRDMSRLRRLEQMRSDFVSNVSHELRTPLANISAAVETLRDAEVRADAETGPRFLEMIRRNLTRLEALLDDILALSRMESRPETLTKEPVDLAAVTRTSVEELRGRAQAAGLELAVDAERRSRVVGDPDTLRRIVDNLLINAITYTPEGGRIDIAIAPQNGTAVLAVRDTGIGIPREDLDRVFERFYRVDKARSRSAGGTGLGLAIVKHAVGLHGGTIEVESELAKGTRITVRIPLASEEGP
jgi:two-component system phosphate regulon sensor histidine kinase PhoR